MPPGTFLLLVAINAMVALVISVLNITSASRRLNHTTAREALRVALALRTELLALAETYAINIARYQAEQPLLSLRTSATLYRASVHRVHLIDERAISMIVAAYAGAERLEAFMATSLTPIGVAGYKHPRRFDDNGHLPALMRTLREETLAAAELLPRPPTTHDMFADAGAETVSSRPKPHAANPTAAKLAAAGRAPPN